MKIKQKQKHIIYLHIEVPKQSKSMSTPPGLPAATWY